MEKVEKLIKALQKAVDVDSEINVFDYKEVPNYEEYFTSSDSIIDVVLFKKMIEMLEDLLSVMEKGR
jgi:hypothetical protein